MVALVRTEIQRVFVFITKNAMTKHREEKDELEEEQRKKETKEN